MVRAAIIFLEHPPENAVAAHHARAVGKILKTKYGHTVFLRPVNRKNTIQEIVKTLPPREAAEKLARTPMSGELVTDIAKRNKALVFNFHASPADGLGQAETKQPHEFRAGIESDHPLMMFMRSPHEISFMKHEGGFTVELPAIFTNLSKEHIDVVMAKRRQIREEMLKLEKDRDIIDSALYALQHTKGVDSNHPQQSKYLDPIISEITAAFIHTLLVEHKKARAAR